jgi:hypothetical protein
LLLLCLKLLRRQMIVVMSDEACCTMLSLAFHFKMEFIISNLNAISS